MIHLTKYINNKYESDQDSQKEDIICVLLDNDWEGNISYSLNSEHGCYMTLDYSDKIKIEIGKERSLIKVLLNKFLTLKLDKFSVLVEKDKLKDVIEYFDIYEYDRLKNILLKNFS